MIGLLLILIGNTLQTHVYAKQPHRLLTLEDTRSLAQSGEILCYSMLLEHGTSAFPHYATILADKTSSHEEIDGVLTVLLLLKVSKGQFYSLVVPFLSHEDDGIRCGAVGLMNEIGTREEGPILIALLSDKYGGVRHAAAEALAAHGGQRELAAMDVWLQSGTALRDNKPYLKHVKECRDMLEQRLKEAEKKEKEKEKK